MNMRSLPTVEDQIARNAASYDDLPYDSYPFPQTHPARLAAIAKIFKLESPPPATARVLELGCAAGGNLIPLAARYPNGQFVGIDLSPRQIDEGSRRISRLGLSNIRLRRQSLTDVRPKDGVFDYIICHGVYSWVPAPVRRAILRIARENLTPNGIAFVSYNVLPGWRLRQTVRDALALHISSDGSLRSRVAKARSLLAFLEQNTACESNWGRIFRHEAAQLKGMADSYIGHEFLEECNEPCTFSEFMQEAASQRLAFLGEADLSSMLPENIAPSAAPLLRAIAGDQLISLEQHIDIFTGRTFRQTLLVHKDRAESCVRHLNPETIENLHFSARPDFAFSREESGQHVFVDGTGARFSTGDPKMRRATEALIARLPGSSSLSELAAELGQSSEISTHATLADGLFKMLIANILTPSGDPTRSASELSVHPVACPMLRQDAATGGASSANLRHERIELDAVAHVVVPLLDGTHDRAALISAIVDAEATGRLSFQRDGKTVTEQSDIERCSSEHVDRVLSNFLRNSCLIG